LLRFDDFSPDHNQIAKSFLDRVLIQQERGIELSVDNAPVVAAIIAESPQKVAMVAMSAVDPKSLRQLGPHLVEARGVEWLCICPPESAVALFSGLPALRQQVVLQTVYARSPERYERLKSHTVHPLIRVDGVVMSNAKGAPLISLRLDELQIKIRDSGVSPAEIDGEVNELMQTFDWEVVSAMMMRISQWFETQKIPMNSASDFKTHLKFHSLLAALPSVLPDATLRVWDQRVISALARMPDATWILKVLDQFPIPSIRRILEMMDAETANKDMAVRNQASRLLKEIRDNIDTLNFENIRMAVESE